MRITVSHNKPEEEIRRAVDRSFDDLIRGVAGMPIQILDEHRSWNGGILSFSFTAQAMFVKTPIKGTVEVARDYITIDADLGLLEKLIPAAKATTAVESKIRALLT